MYMYICMNKYLFTVHVTLYTIKKPLPMFVLYRIAYISGNAERLEERLGSNPIAAHSTAWPNAHAPHDVRRSSARLGAEVQGSVSLGWSNISQSTIFWKRSVFFYLSSFKKEASFLNGWLTLWGNTASLEWSFGLFYNLFYCMYPKSSSSHACCPCCLLPPHPSGAPKNPDTFKLKPCVTATHLVLWGIYILPNQQRPREAFMANT